MALDHRALASITELSALIRRGQATPSEVVEGCLRRVAEAEDGVQAWAYLAQEEARGVARQRTEQLRRGGSCGVLYGIPFGVKDIYDTAGMPTEWGSPLYAGRVPPRDAELVGRLAAAGAIVVGKTHTTAFAYFDPGPTRNPRHLQHTPGGSSSGSAAAVAAGMVPFALGSQTLGSVLRPASFCGVVGFKPTYGRLPTAGMLPFAPTLDHAGLFTRTAAEMALLWAAITGRSEDRPPKGAPAARLAVPPWPIEGRLEPEMSEAFDACLERLRSAGLPIDEVPLPESFARLPAATDTIVRFEGARTHRERFLEFGACMGPKLAALVEAGLGLHQGTYQAAIQAVGRAKAEFAERTVQHAVWITPAALGPAPPGLESTGDPRANAPFTALGVPALCLPFGRTDKGLPLGLQLATAAGDDALLLAAGAALEPALNGA